jgi:uncharacterized membrane protein YfcA
MDLLYLTLIAMGGSFIQSLSGFGYAAFCMALWPIVIPFKQAIILEIISAFLMVAFISIRFFKKINFRIMIFPLITSIVFSTLGMFTLFHSAETILRRVLGIILVFFALYFMFFNGKIKIKPTPINGLISGAVSGLLGGIFGIGGPPAAVYFLAVIEDKIEYNATLQCYFLIMSVFIFAIHFAYGNINIATLTNSGIIIPGVFAGMVCGFYILKKTSIQTIKNIASLFIAVLGVYLTIKG